MPPQAEASAAVRLHDVYKRFGSVRALRGSTLSLRSGEVHAVLGENGAGKTTLLRILAGLSSPDSGELFVAGQPTRFPHVSLRLVCGDRVGPPALHVGPPLHCA